MGEITTLDQILDIPVQEEQNFESVEDVDLSFNFEDVDVTKLDDLVEAEESEEDSQEDESNTEDNDSQEDETSEDNNQEGSEDQSNEEDSQEDSQKDRQEGSEEDGDEDTSQNDFNYKSVVENMVKKGLWEKIEYFETDEGDVSFEDMEINEDTFAEIYKHNLESEKSKLTENKISTEDISDFTKKVIEIDKNGGNVQEALQVYQKFKHPLEGLDLSKESDQNAAIYVKLKSTGTRDEDIYELLKIYKKSGNLEQKAIEAKEQVDKAVDAHLEKLNENAIKQKEEKSKLLKQYKGKLEENFNKFQINDSLKKKMVNLAVKEDNNQYQIDTLYQKTIKNPELATDLLFFLFDKKAYLEQHVENAKNEINTRVFKKIKTAKKGKAGSTLEKEVNNKNFIDLKKINLR